MGYLSDLARRQIAGALLAIAAIVVVMAVADVGPFSDPPTPAQEVTSAVERFYASASDGDFKTYCSLLTRQAQSRIQANAARLIDNTDIGGCQEILEMFGKPLEDGMLRMHQVSVSGNRARAQVNYPTKNTKGPQPHTVLLELDRKSNQWLVYDPG